LIVVLGTAKFRAHCGQDHATSYDVMAEFSKWLEADEESIFSLETEKTCQLHPTNCPKPRPELKNSQK
jgi:hypothetical protein